MRTGTRRGPERCTRAGSNHSRCKPTSTSWPCVATWSAIPCGPTWSSKQKPGAGEVYGIGCTARRTGSWPPGRWRSLRFGWSTSMRRNRNRNWLVAALCDARQSVWRRRLAYGHGGDTGVAVHAPTAHSAVALKNTPDPFFFFGCPAFLPFRAYIAAKEVWAGASLRDALLNMLLGAAEYF